MAKKYGESFLTRTVFATSSLYRAERSRFQWRASGTSRDYYELSWLGVINGLPIFSKYWRLMVILDEDHKTILGWRVGKLKPWQR